VAIKYPIRKRVKKGPKIVNRGSGVKPMRPTKSPGGHPPVAKPPKRVTHRPHPTSMMGASGMTTPKAPKRGRR
jgi:hypothetical protein